MASNSKQQQQQQQYETTDVYEFKRNAISDSINKFNELASSLNEVSKCANHFVQSLQLLENIAMPEVIGNSIHVKVPRRKIFDNTGHLMEKLNTFNDIFSLYSERVRQTTVGEFDNFIMQVLTPNHAELNGAYEHNKNIIEELRNGFYSVMNHFYVLSAELFEKFLICGNCDTPNGFAHQLSCSEKRELTFTWRKTKLDDKFMTYGMKFGFYDHLIPSQRRVVVDAIKKSVSKPYQVKTETDAPVYAEWPGKWNRGKGNYKKKKSPKVTAIVRKEPTPPTIIKPSIWTPSDKESEKMSQNYDVISFSYQ